jgi:hypothetical protein
MAVDKRILEDELKQYAINTLNFLADEVDLQFGKWSTDRTGFLPLLCDAHQQAVDKQVAILREDAEERRRSFERGLFVFSLISIGATSWFGAYLELRLAPEIFFEYEQVPVILPTRWRKKITNEFESKVFGDSGHAVADALVELGVEKLKPEPFSGPNPQEVAGAPDAQIFAGNLFRVVNAQRVQAVKTIKKIAEGLNNSMTFGTTLVKRLQKENPRFNSLSPRDQQLAGQKLIIDWLNVLRSRWAARWLFYGSDPPNPSWSVVRDQLEMQLWAVWTIQQSFHLQGFSGNSPSERFIEGATTVLTNDSKITKRLNELHAQVTDIVGDKHRNDRDRQDQLDGLNKWAASSIQNTAWIETNKLQAVPRKIKPASQLFSSQ